MEEKEPLQQKATQKRQVAYKIPIKQILDNQYIKEEGEWSPNYIQIQNRKVSRVNVFAVVVSAEKDNESMYDNVIIDDGTGKITVRSFEGGQQFEGIEVGNPVTVIGRPREYANERYIVAEIIKKVSDPVWAEVRKRELHPDVEEPTEQPPTQKTQPKPQPDTNSKVVAAIKELDSGSGADMQEIVNSLNVENPEAMIQRMLEQGEVFEIKPGKIKVLE